MFDIVSKTSGEVLVSASIVSAVIICIALLILSFVVNKKVKQSNVDDVPSNFMNVIEMTVESVDKLVRQNMGEKQAGFGAYIYTLMAFILFSNLSGLLGFTPPTSNYSVTLTLALITFTLTQYYGLRNNGLGGYIKGYFEPMAFLVPLNVIGELANPVSLSFRLFGNVLSGVIIMDLLYGALGKLSVIIAPPLHAYFDIFSGALQTFIFGMLTMIFIGGSFEEE